MLGQARNQISPNGRNELYQPPSTYITHTRYHTAPSPLKSFSRKVTMGGTPSVTEVEKDVACTARLFSLFFMKRKGCTVGDNQALSMTFCITHTGCHNIYS